MNKEMYMVLKICRWDGMVLSTGQRFAGYPGSEGCCLIYSSLEALRADWPDAKYVVVSEES